jgi:integrase/recombinase XerD
MAFLTKKGDRYYICESYQVAELDGKGLPIKDDNNKPVYKNKIKWTPSSKNKKLAEIELGKYEEDKDRGRIGLDRLEASWQSVKEKYLSYSKAAKSLSSFKLDAFTFRDIEKFAPRLNSVKELTLSFAESFFAWLKSELKNSEATIRRKGTTLKNIWKKLVDWEIVKDNPLQKLEIKKITNEREIKYWKNTDDIKKIIDASSGCWKTINILGFYIGTRISEALNSEFSFVDFDNHTIKIQSSGTFRTKSRKFRIIKMPQYLEKHLLELKKERNKNHKIKTAKIAIYSDGGSPNMETASSYLKKFYKKQGFEGYHSHCLRHTFAAQYLLKYKDIYGLSKILGHHSVTITEKYYGHLIENYYDGTMSKFELV